MKAFLKNHSPIIENIKVVIYVFVVFIFFLKDLAGETDDVRCFCIFIDYKANQDKYSYESSNVGKIVIYFIETSSIGGRSA